VLQGPCPPRSAVNVGRHTMWQRYTRRGPAVNVRSRRSEGGRAIRVGPPPGIRRGVGPFRGSMRALPRLKGSGRLLTRRQPLTR